MGEKKSSKNSEVSEKIIVILLIIAIVLSVFSIMVTFQFYNFDNSGGENFGLFDSVDGGTTSGNIGFIIEETEANTNGYS